MSNPKHASVKRPGGSTGFAKSLSSAASVLGAPASFSPPIRSSCASAVPPGPIAIAFDGRCAGVRGNSRGARFTEKLSTPAARKHRMDGQQQDGAGRREAIFEGGSKVEGGVRETAELVER